MSVRKGLYGGNHEWGPVGFCRVGISMGIAIMGMGGHCGLCSDCGFVQSVGIMILS